MSRVWLVYLTDYMHNLKVAREEWSKRPITFTVKSLKETLADNSGKKFKITRISTCNNIRVCEKIPLFSFFVLKIKL